MQRRWVVSPHYRLLIANLTSYRERMGVSQRELARRLGKPASFVNKIELMERRWDLLEVAAYARALDVEIGDFVRDLAAGLPSDWEL